jgi:hypothetical protein
LLLRQSQQVIFMALQAIHTLEPAHTIVESLGGRTHVAEKLGVDRSTVARWCVPYPAGTGGKIPQRYWKDLIRLGRASGVDLTIGDLSGFEF